MYKIVGADQKEYGPVTAGELRQWIADGRADAQTLTQAEGSTEWKALGTMPEFAGAFAVPPAPPSFAPVTPISQRERTNGMAVAGLVLAIFGLFLCCGPLFSTLGLIFSCLSLNQINQDASQRGRSLAIAGIILSICGYLLFIGLISTRVLRPGFRRRRFL
ncbi:MAG TPA: DUF4190 domain-containing protein [Verrucomicrobiae bacterium]|nr:DUF4190 domain-containing protein [Verrucomicrobiae bacterium]